MIYIFCLLLLQANTVERWEGQMTKINREFGKQTITVRWQGSHDSVFVIVKNTKIFFDGKQIRFEDFPEPPFRVIIVWRTTDADFLELHAKSR